MSEPEAPDSVSERVYALIFNGITKASSAATDDRDWIRLSERERIAEAVFAELRAGNIEFRLGGLALLAAAVEREAMPKHLRGDGPCHDCGSANIIWSTDSALWNLVVGGPQATDDPGGLLCAPCFVGRAEALGLAPAGWYLGPWSPTDPGARLSAGTEDS